MAHPCPRGCISRPQVHHTRVSRDRGSAPGRRHPRAMDAAPAPDFHRLSGLTSLSGWLPTTLPQGSSHMAATIAPAPKRHQRNLVITLAAAALKADLAPRHYRIAPPSDMPRKAPSAASGRRPVVTGRCASDRAPDGHRHGAHHRLVGASHLHVGPAGVRRPRDAPTALDGHQPHPVIGRHRRRAAPRRLDAEAQRLAERPALAEAQTAPAARTAAGFDVFFIHALRQNPRLGHMRRRSCSGCPG